MDRQILRDREGESFFGNDRRDARGDLVRFLGTWLGLLTIGLVVGLNQRLCFGYGDLTLNVLDSGFL